MNKKYSIKETENGLFEIHRPNGEVLKTYRGKAYDGFSHNVAKNLCEDLNHILAAPVNHFGEIEAVERTSLIYCVLSTIREFEVEEHGAVSNVEVIIQDDYLFRFDPFLGQQKIERFVSSKVQEQLGEHWIRLPFGIKNLAGESKADAELVPEGTVASMLEIYNSLSPAQKVIVDIVYHAFEEFSITSTILHVSGKVNESDYYELFANLTQGQFTKDMNEEDYEEVRFQLNRLLYLKILNWAYQNQDPFLPGRD